MSGRKQMNERREQKYLVVKVAGESRGSIDKREDRRGEIVKIIKKFESEY